MTLNANAQSLLLELKPEGFASENAGLQERKSSETRIVILEAAVECLARYGYARTTTHMIAKLAKASRGAMLHHYPTKHALIAAVIEFAFYRHMEDFIRSIQQLSEKDRVGRNAGIFADWKSCLTREYKAYVELNMAASTDEELRAVFLPRAREHDRIWRDQLVRVFPEWADDRARLDVASKFVRTFLDGMLLSRDIWDDQDTETMLLDFVAAVVTQVREGKLRFGET